MWSDDVCAGLSLFLSVCLIFFALIFLDKTIDYCHFAKYVSFIVNISLLSLSSGMLLSWATFFTSTR